jgi:hypothetical protein
MITKENIVEIFDYLDNSTSSYMSLSDINYTLFNILSNIAFYNHCDLTSRQSIISSLTEDNLKEFEKQLLSYALSNSFMNAKYLILYFYVKYCNYDEKIIKGIVFSDIIMASYFDFFDYSEKVMDIIYTPEEKKEMTLFFWKTFFEDSKFSFLFKKGELNENAFEHIDISLNHIYTDRAKIESIEKEIFKQRVDILFSQSSKKHIRKVYREMIVETKSKPSSAFVKIGLDFFLKTPEFRRMYIQNKLGDAK